METRVIKVPSGVDSPLGYFKDNDGPSRLEEWCVDDNAKAALQPLQEAATYLTTKDTPVAFPTETVYGLGADATRSASVKGIYSAKGRPSDNPLIVHVCDLHMLRSLLGNAASKETIPSIYKPLIDKFWPGPLTILLPNPEPSKLAPEVTAGLSSFGARMPSSTLALSLIKLSGVPLAAPSANASTKPSPTAAHHVKHDLDGRIELILDGGPCQVGVESTVVDGLCDPPVVLRPGGISLEELRSCPGWENVTKAYKDQSEEGKAAPRAPGMKYKHYSPKARVILYETTYSGGSSDGVSLLDAEAVTTPVSNGHSEAASTIKKVGVIRTQRWKLGGGLKTANWKTETREQTNGNHSPDCLYETSTSDLLDITNNAVIGQLYDIDLGMDTKGIAQGLFSALRELDSHGADIIFVDGIDDSMDIAAAVMNRLRKAASEIRS